MTAFFKISVIYELKEQNTKSKKKRERERKKKEVVCKIVVFVVVFVVFLLSSCSHNRPHEKRLQKIILQSHTPKRPRAEKNAIR